MPRTIQNFLCDTLFIESGPTSGLTEAVHTEPKLLFHAQVLITSWVVIAILLGSVIIAVRNPQTIPTDGQNFFEYVLEFIQDLSKTQIGEGYGPWVFKY